MQFWKDWRARRARALILRELEPLVKSWQWTEHADQETLALARKDLLEFLRRGKTLLPKAVKLEFEPLAFNEGGELYVRRMLAAKKSLFDGRWDHACHDLYDVIHFHRVEDRCVLLTILKLVEEFCSENKNDQAVLESFAPPGHRPNKEGTISANY